MIDDIKDRKIYKSLDKEAIEYIIPHRDEFLLIEKVTILEKGIEAIGFSNIKEGSWFFKGHFPDYKIMPGVLIIEAMAQTSSVCTLETIDSSQGAPVFFIKIQNATFRKPIFPETELYYHIKLERKFRSFYTFECNAFFFQNEKKIIAATANIMATM